MFHDIHQEADQQLMEHRVKGAEFDDVVYSDDTICISQGAEAMNTFLAKVEEEGELYGMRLNKGKCELMKYGVEARAKVQFRDGSKLKPQNEVKNLGCYLNRKADGGK